MTMTTNPEIRCIPVFRDSFEVNCYLVSCPETKETLIIDPGTMDHEEQERLFQVIRNHELFIKGIINTHGHLDHIAGNGACCKTYSAPLYIHSADAAMLTDATQNGSAMFGLKIISPDADILLDGEESISCGSLKLKVLHTPGHTKGCISLWCGNAVFTGDTLFAGSVGRTDLPGGNFEEEMTSIKEKLFKLPNDVLVYPGHGPESTIALEKSNNMFVV